MFRTLALVLLAAPAFAADPPPNQQYLEFIRAQAAALRAKDAPPARLAEWQTQRESLRKQLLAAWGGFPAEPCPLNPKSFGTLKRDGYTVEKLAFQTRPGVWMTANAYVPDKAGKHPAILMVHGHWKGAKQDPVVQARCIGAAKLGFFVLCVDAFGAGERGVGKALGEYHGEMTAATLLPVGLPLSGLQVYENMRAVDYLRTRPEVDGDKIGITGASGGGNQTMYAGGWDDRFKAVVPVCSVGNYQSYLGAACCMCEVVPGALRFTEEWGVLGLAAPRGLMVVNATQDARQFSVAEAKKSLALAEPVFKLHGKSANLKHATFEGPHDYSKAMREAMYGWMTLHLKGQGDGSPITEPAIKTEDPEALRCYPGTTRPDDWVTIPKFAAAEARKMLAAKPEPKTADEWKATSEQMRTALVEKVFGGFPKVADTNVIHGSFRLSDDYRFTSEPGLHLTADVNHGTRRKERVAIVLNLDGAASAATRTVARSLEEDGWAVANLTLRATGTLSLPNDKIGRAPDHNSAEWSLWIGRPLLGQWVFDVRQFLDVANLKETTLIGEGPAGLVALAAAATDKRITKVAAVGTLASYVTEEPYVGQRLGVMAPGILREVGDVAHLAALCAPRRVVIAGGVAGNGKALDLEKLREAYRPAQKVYDLLGAEGRLRVVEKDVIEALK